ncbi:MAG: AMP-binding protein, partial [Pseudomonadales bacterium]|nr:AMP-binding protein [Pseudomonadales bacterium]
MSGYPYCEFTVLEEAAGKGMTLARYARDTPDRVAVYSGFGQRTFDELNRRANQLVRCWRRAGVVAGDSVAMLLGNRPEFLEVYKAALRSGVRLTPINWHLTGEEVAYIVDNCEAKVFVSERRFAEAAHEALAANPDLLLSLMVDHDGSNEFRDYGEALAGEDATDIEDPEFGRYMLYTSGTTGRPKGVWRANREPLVPMWKEGRVPMRPLEDCCLLTGPAYHAAPLMSIARSLISGVPVVMMDKWDPEETLKLIEKHRV